MPGDDYLRTQSDPVGPDTQQRFRAQASVAARYAVGCIADEPLYDEVLVETVDDIVLRKVSGKNAAVQVKTKVAGRLSETSNSVASALRGFLRHHQHDCDTFDEYILETNQPLATPPGEDLNLGQLLDQGRERSFTGPEKKRLSNLLRGALGVERLSPGVFDGILGKMRVRLTAPTLTDIVKPVEDQLRTTVSSYTDATWRIVDAGAKALVASMLEASANAHREGSDVPHRSPHASQRDELAADLAARRFDAERILAILANTETFLLSDPTTPAEINELGDGEHRLRAKMEAGAITPRTIERVVDSHEDLERILVKWHERHGSEKAREYYAHARHIVGDAATAAEASAMVTTPDGQPYGLAMYADLFDRLASQPDQPGMPTASQQAVLLAVAGRLTRECRLWWSPDGDVEGIN